MSIWFDATVLPELGSPQFSPSGYAKVAPVAGQGGRGSAWFVDTAAGPAVLKHYRRGGWMAKITDDRYFAMHTTATRSFGEFNLLTYLRGEDLPVPAPLAAFALSRFGFYRAALLTARIAGARSLVEAVHAQTAPWAEVGATLARFHALHVRHPDLNAYNILVDGDNRVYLIDWDKGAVDHSDGWFDKVISRLVRSLHKECAAVDADYLASGVQQMRDAYDRGIA